MTAIALTIAGSDSGGGAGLQADLKTFSALGVYGCSVVTAITAQNTMDVTAIHQVPTAVVASQIEAVLEDLDVRAIKIGMLGTPDLIEQVARSLERFAGPVVLDPVMVAKSGAQLLAGEAVDALVAALVGRASVLTPNIPEAARLLGVSETAITNDPVAKGRCLLAKGPGAVLMKGGHAEGSICTDWLVTTRGARAFNAERIDTRNTHGTGCSLSSAIAAGLAQDLPVDAAVSRAHDWLYRAICTADLLNVGRGHGPVHHFHAFWP